MKRILKFVSLIAMFFSVAAHAGTYTFTTDSNTDTLLQQWCFAYNAYAIQTRPAGGLFSQPANASGITAANVKLCIKDDIQASAVQLQSTSYGAAFTPSQFTQMN